MALAEMLVAAFPEDISHQRALAHRLYKLARLAGSDVSWLVVAASWERLAAMDDLSPTEQRCLDWLRRHAGTDGAPTP